MIPTQFISDMKGMYLKQRPQVNWLPILGGVIALCITLFLWQALLLQRDTSIAKFTHLAAKSIKSEIANRMLFQVNSLTRMVRRWESRGGTPKDEWEADALAHVSGYNGYQTMEWIEPSLHVRWAVPRRSVKSAQSILIDVDAKKQHLIEKAMLTKEPVVSEIIDLVKGEHGLLIVLPIYIKQQFNGFIVGLVDVKRFLDDVIGMHTVPGYNIQITKGSQLIYQRGSQAEYLEKHWAKDEVLDLYGTQWNIHVWPEPNLLAESSSVLPNLILVVGLVITSLLIFTLQFSQMAKAQANKIAEVNRNLQKEINERELAEQAKAEMKRALLQSQKMQAIGTLAGGIAHDFNNILYSMIGYVEMARDDVETGSLTYENLSKVISVGQRGQELVARLLSFSRQQQHDFKPLAISEVVDSTLVLLKPTIPASIALSQANQLEANATVLGGHTELQQVLVNAVSNAVDAIDDQGKIELRLARVLADDSFRERFPKLRKSSYILITIADNGKGMPAHISQRIFEPFFTTKEVGKGTGLGLATALGIVHDHGGEMIVESQVQQGTKVFIYLPEFQLMEEEEHGSHIIGRG